MMWRLYRNTRALRGFNLPLTLVQSLILLLLSLPWMALAQGEMALKATTVGADLQWELEGYEVWLVPQGERGRIVLYSPGLDPEDYRSALKGKEELGDERYDRGQGTIQTVFQLYQGPTLLREATFGIEPHREVVFFEGPTGNEPLLLRIRMLVLHPFLIFGYERANF